MTGRWVEVAIFALALVVFGLVALALVWSGDWAYALLANLNGVRQISFLRQPTSAVGGGEALVDLPTVISSWHHPWAAYVTGVASVPALASGTPVFTQDEYAHMADVRAVFRGAEVAAALAFLVAAYRIARARMRGDALRLIRAGSAVAAVVVGAIGLAAAVAFDPLFLLFHDVFFPQGNFLFDPATSNLLRLYPEWYWQGITAGVGVSFIAAALLVAAVSHVVDLRRGSNTYTRAA